MDIDRPNFRMTAAPSGLGAGFALTIRKLRSAIDLEIKRRLDDLDVTPPMGRVLVALRSAEEGGCTQRALADALGVTQPTMSTTLDGLVRRGLVRIADDDMDKRRNLVRLTQRGDEAASAMVAAEAAVISAMLEGVAARDLDAALRGMRSMLANLDPIAGTAATEVGPAAPE